MSSIGRDEQAVFAYGLAPDWRRYAFDWQAGRPAAVILASTMPPDELSLLVNTFARLTASFVERKADVLVLLAAEQTQSLVISVNAPSCIELIECDTTFLAARNASPGVVAVVVDRNLRVALECKLGPPQDIAAACLNCLDELMREMPAPVIILPNLLTQAFCRDLIDRFESGGNIEGKVSGTDAAGNPNSYVDHTIKQRRDLQIPHDDPLSPVIRQMLIERCAPEIEKAFGRRIVQTDRLMLARYDALNGWFRRHRDNATANVAFREFAVSVNLNTGDYDGGQLIFPEYNDHPYCAPTGAGLIFSASLLHEVASVSQGSRYVLTTFFYGEAAGSSHQDSGVDALL